MSEWANGSSWCVPELKRDPKRIMKNTKTKTQNRHASSPPTTGGITLAVRVDEQNELHHLWSNHGIWWCHFTVHRPDFTAKRIRVSLRTRDIEKAKQKRDKIFDQIESGTLVA